MTASRNQPRLLERVAGGHHHGRGVDPCGWRFTNAPATGSFYNLGETIRAAVTWSQPVTVDTKGANANVRLRLDLGPDDADRGNSRKTMAYESGTGTDTLTFAYAVKPGELDTDGVWLQTQSATVDDLVVFLANGATLQERDDRTSRNTRAGTADHGRRDRARWSRPARRRPRRVRTRRS